MSSGRWAPHIISLMRWIWETRAKICSMDVIWGPRHPSETAFGIVSSSSGDMAGVRASCPKLGSGFRPFFRGVSLFGVVAGDGRTLPCLDVFRPCCFAFRLKAGDHVWNMCQTRGTVFVVFGLFHAFLASGLLCLLQVD